MRDEIPQGWTRTTIDKVLAPLDDGRVLHHGWSPQCLKEPSPSSDAWSVLKTTAIQSGRFLPEHNKQLPDNLKPRAQLEVRAGDILLTCAGPRVRCGVPCLVRETRPKLILSGKMYRFRARPDVMDPRFLEAQLLSQAAQAAIDAMKTGISDSGLNLTHDRFKKLPTIVAPLQEQRQIVAAIESHFSRLDAATATLERVQRSLERYRASVLKAAVEGRLVPTEAELAKKERCSYEPASVLLKRILAERRRRWEEAELAKLHAKGKSPTDDRWKARYEGPAVADAENLPALPEGWCWASLDQIVALGPQNGLYVPKSEYGHGTPIVRVDDYQDQSSRCAAELLLVNIGGDLAKSFGLAVGDILINRVNSPTHLGKSLVVEARHLPAVFESNIMRMHIAGGIPPALVHYYLCSLDGRRRLLSNAKWAVNQASINQRDVLTTPLPLPPADEAVRIVRSIDSVLTAKSTAQTSTGTSQRHIARLRQSILKWAFEGRLVEPQHTEASAIQ